jgi:hypothetical protein
MSESLCRLCVLEIMVITTEDAPKNVGVGHTDRSIEVQEDTISSLERVDRGTCVHLQSGYASEVAAANAVVKDLVVGYVIEDNVIIKISTMGEV